MTASRVIRAYWPGLILAGILAGILRAFAARGELWLDEIWSLVTVRQTIKSPIEIITVLKLDNNHFINSLWIWRTNLSQMQIAGGSVAAYWRVIVDTMSLSVGVAPGLPEAAVGAGCMLLLSLFVVRFLLKTEPQDAFLLIFSAIVVPAILLAVMNRQDIYPRYFLIGTLLFQLSLARWIASLLETGCGPQRRYRQLAGCALLFAFVSSNATLDRQLIVLQRGHYQDAIRWLQENAKSESILLGVDHPFRHRFPLGYYVARTEIGERLRLTTSPEQVPDWLLVHDLNRTAQPPETVASASGVQFRFQKLFRAAPLSGWNLLIYRRDGSESSGSAEDSEPQ